ncbi:MAG: 50S ribosomal protein L4 [Omnitrophica bacterium RIFCSPLOWO2_12_FULL_50_11]|nr:MAG: 50S ribosomal protein L4 [Omnitrophica bacterium RIFCSPLOWO2_12_FULL_50_11]
MFARFVILSPAFGGTKDPELGFFGLRMTSGREIQIMADVTLYEKDGKINGAVTVNDDVFGAPVNERLLSLVVTAYGGNARVGTHDTKTRGEVRGGGRKPWKQKGTGRARHGSRRSPIWRGGGTVFGPHPRSYRTHLSDDMKRSALISALSLKNRENNLMFLKEANLKEPKTKELASIASALQLDHCRTLFIVSSMEDKLKRASRNLRATFSVRPASDVNAYHIVRRKKLLIEKDAVPILERRALGEAAAAARDQVRVQVT